MTSRDEDIAWFRELLAPIGPTTARRMFGGTGFYVDGTIIALEIEGTLYLKTDAQTRQRFAEAGGSPFVYAGKGRQVETSYWTPPDEALDAPDAMRPWARLALEASARSGAVKPRSKKMAAKKATAKKTTAKKVAIEKTAVKKSASKKISAKASAPTRAGREPARSKAR